MVNRFSLVAFATFFVSGSAFAGYAQVAPPSNWTTSLGASFYKAASNDVSFAGGVRGSAGVVNVGGRMVAMPAAYRFAANAGQVAARAAFLNPAWFIGVSALTLAYNHFSSNDFEVEDGIWKKRVEELVGQWCTTGTPAVCGASPLSAANSWFVPTAKTCSGSGASLYCTWVEYTDIACPTPGVNSVTCTAKRHAKWSHATQGSGTSTISNSSVFLSLTQVPVPKLIPATAQEFEEKMSPLPLPDGVPQQLPVPLPVEPVPILNPSADPVPVPQPMRVPMGEPVPVPNTNPQQWKTPVVDLVPKISSPWIVDLQPKDITKEDATPLPDSEPVPVTPPAGQSETPATPDLCEKNPDILACQKVGLGSLDPSVITENEKALAITKDGGWGPENGTCPAPKTAVVMGVSLSLPFTMLCDFANGIRPLLIGFAWLSAALTFFGFARRD